MKFLFNFTCTKFNTNFFRLFSTTNNVFEISSSKIDAKTYTFKRIESDKENIEKFNMNTDNNLSINFLKTKIRDFLLEYYNEDNYKITLIMTADKGCLIVYGSDDLNKYIVKNLNTFVEKILIELYLATEEYPIDNIELWIEKDRETSTNSILSESSKISYNSLPSALINHKTNKRNYSTFSNRRLFSISTLRPNIKKELFVNSDINNVIFKEYDKYNHKAVLFLPTLLPFMHLISAINKNNNINDDYSLLINFKDFYLSFTNTFKQLELGKYSFEYYFYIKTLEDYCLTECYTQDFLDTNCLNSIMGSRGYCTFLNILDTFDPNELENIYSVHSTGITNRLKEILEIDKSVAEIDLNRETLLVITKVNEINNKQLSKEQDTFKTKIPGLQVGYTKRFYSTSNFNLCTLNNKAQTQYYSTKINVNTKQPINKVIHIAFSDYVNYGSDSYINIFKNNLTLGVKYSYIVKISKDNLYYTLSERQKFFLLDGSAMDEVRLDYFEDYLHVNLSRVLELYKKVIDGECDVITFEFSPLFNDTNIKEFEIKNLELVNSRLPLKSYNRIKKEFSLFDTNILNYKGTLLNFNINDCEFTNNIEDLNYFSFENVKYLNYNKYYYVKYRGKSYVVTEYIKDNIKIKQCLDKFGINLYYVEDTIKEDGGFIRKEGNFYTHFSSENEITNIQKDITFNSIFSKLKLSDKPSVNQNIGTIDLETFKHDETSLCYAIGFYTENDSKMYYIDKDNLDSYILIHNCINELLRPKYKPFTFYCHNLGGFDAPFIIKALLEFNKNVDKAERYTFNSFTRDGNIIRLTIRRRVEGKIRSITLNDSLPILSMSLRSLCKAYKVEQAKSYFPYDFVNKNTLFYVGNTPNKSYYLFSAKDGTSEEDFNKFYESSYSKTWSLQQETLNYLMLDLKSLYEVIKIVNLQLFLLFDIQMTESSTVSGIAMRIFLNKFYKNTDKLPLINSRQIYNDIYKAYYGGRVEVFIPKPINNEKLYYYDVNSLYPYASLNDLPGLNWNYNEFIQKPNLYDLFGFYYCKVESNNNYLGLLPFRNEKGGLSFPKGKWYGWYFSEELKLAAKYGYKIEIIKGYTTDKSKNVFEEFVNSIYQVKLKPRNNAEKNVAKLILNSLIGRFGMNPDKLVTKLLNNKEHLTVCSTRVLKNSIILDDDNYLDTFSTDINKDVCNEFGLDYTKVLNSKNFYIEKAKPISNNTISISTAAAILSYSRIYMADTMQMILNKGGRIYYTDTDSIVTNIKLPDNMIDSNELGKFKLEHEVVEAYFISDKTYLIKNIEGKVIKKAKSVKEDSLDIKDYIRFYNMEVYESAIKTTAKRDYTRGSVNIDSKKVTLNIDKYTKRERIFINKSWVNSKPIWINCVDKSLILYDNHRHKSVISYNKVNKFDIILYTNNKILTFDHTNKRLKLDSDCKWVETKPFNLKIKDITYKYRTLAYSISGENTNTLLTILNHLIIKLNIKNFINYIVSNIKGIFINFILFILCIITSIILFYFMDESLDSMGESGYLDFNNFNLKDYPITNNESISHYKNLSYDKSNLLKTNKYKVYLSNSNLRPIHLSLYDLNKYVSTHIDLLHPKYNYLRGSSLSDFSKEYYYSRREWVSSENVSHLIKYYRFNFDYINTEFRPAYLKKYLYPIINDLWHNIISNNISNKNSFKSIDSIKDYSLEYLLDKCNNNKIKISTLDFINIMNNITSYFTEGHTTSWDKLKLINNLTTHTFSASPESYVDLSHNSNTSLINPYGASSVNDKVLISINNNITLNTSNFSLRSTSNILTQNNINLQIPSTPVQDGAELDMRSPLLEVSPLISDNKSDLGANSNLTNSEILKWRNEIWKTRNRS
uniref:DNA polymerase n=2 Tax=Gibberella intermedia TaxID=948311 RepID=A6N8J0_GIBIN|nr:DNA polymerase [Fusarium proliferatum]